MAAADVTGDGKADIVTGPAFAGGSLVETFDGVTKVKLTSFGAGKSRRSGEGQILTAVIQQPNRHRQSLEYFGAKFRNSIGELGLLQPPGRSLVLGTTVGTRSSKGRVGFTSLTVCVLAAMGLELPSGNGGEPAVRQAA